MSSKARCLFAVLIICVLLCSCAKSDTPLDESKFVNRIDCDVVNSILDDIKETEYAKPDSYKSVELPPILSRKINLVLDSSESVASFLKNDMMTYSEILTSLTDVFAGTSVSCYEAPAMNIGGEITLEIKEGGLNHLDKEWRNYYSSSYPKISVGTNLSGLIEATINEMNNNSVENELFVILTDITPQPVPGSSDENATKEIEEQMANIGRLLAEKVTSDVGSTFGIIGIQADKTGDLYGMPATTSARSGNSYTIRASEISTQGSYKTPLYLLLLGDEQLVQEYADRLCDEISTRINTDENGIKKYIFPHLEVRKSIFDDSLETKIIELPSVELSERFSSYAIGGSNPNYIYNGDSINQIENVSIPFFRLYEKQKYDGNDASVIIRFAENSPRTIYLSPGNIDYSISADYFNVNRVEIMRIDSSEIEESSEVNGSVETTEDNDKFLIRGSIDTETWNLTLKPNELELDKPVLFIAKANFEFDDGQIERFVSDTVIGDADWLFADDTSESSWSVNMDDFNDFRSNGGRLYGQETRTPYLSNMANAIIGVVKESEAAKLKNETYTQTALFGFVVRDSAAAYYYDNFYDDNLTMLDDPLNVAIPDNIVKRLEDTVFQ